jgi:hypothetical protein
VSCLYSWTPCGTRRCSVILTSVVNLVYTLLCGPSICKTLMSSSGMFSVAKTPLVYIVCSDLGTSHREDKHYRIMTFTHHFQHTSYDTLNNTNLYVCLLLLASLEAKTRSMRTAHSSCARSLPLPVADWYRSPYLSHAKLALYHLSNAPVAGHIVSELQI